MPIDDEHAPAADTRVDALRDFVARVGPSEYQFTAQVDTACAEALSAFDGAGVEALLLKGRALQESLYDDGELRAYSDVDLLVAPADLRTAERALAELGYVNGDAAHGIDDVGGVVHGQTWARAGTSGGAPAMIDLHRWLPGSRADPALAWTALMAHRSSIHVAGRKAAVLDQSGQAMQLATHAAQHGPEAGRNLDELTLALERWPTDVWSSAADLAREIGATEAFTAGLRLLPEGQALATELRLPATAEMDWTIRNRSARPRGTFHLRALAESGSTRERIAIVRRSLLPPRAWIVDQYPWTRRGGPAVWLGYALHIARAPVWAARAWRFRSGGRRAARKC